MDNSNHILRICIIGDSHTAALKLGFDQMADSLNFNHEITFFGATGVRLSPQHLFFSNGCFYGKNTHLINYFKTLSGGLGKIVLKDYDCFVLSGLSVDISAYIELFGRFQSNIEINQKSKEFLYLISEECFQSAQESILINIPCYYIFKTIKENSNKPVFIIPAPFPGSSKLSGEAWRNINKFKNLSLFKTQFQKFIAKIYSSSIVVYPPKKVLSTPINTKLIYTKDSYCLNLVNKYKPGHTQHMNADYGEIMLGELFKTIIRENI